MQAREIILAALSDSLNAGAAEWGGQVFSRSEIDEVIEGLATGEITITEGHDGSN